MRAPLAFAGGAVVAGGWLWARTHPEACPYSQRWMLDLPRPFLGVGPLLAMLEPRPGERLLELGPGTGIHTLDVAQALEPRGTLAIFDIQQEMLDHVMREAEARGVGNLEPRQGDATDLPYEDASFDGAFLVTVLGEIPDGDKALRELRRVVKPGARVVFGETAFDPHVVFPAALERRCAAAGLTFERRTGVVPLGWLDRYVAS